MAIAQLIQQLQDRVGRLLLRHEELRRSHELLQEEHAKVTQERDALRQRLEHARQRVDALMGQLPDPEEPKS